MSQEQLENGPNEDDLFEEIAELVPQQFSDLQPQHGSRLTCGTIAVLDYLNWLKDGKPSPPVLSYFEVEDRRRAALRGLRKLIPEHIRDAAGVAGASTMHQEYGRAKLLLAAREYLRELLMPQTESPDAVADAEVEQPSAETFESNGGSGQSEELLGLFWDFSTTFLDLHGTDHANDETAGQGAAGDWSTPIGDAASHVSMADLLHKAEQVELFVDEQGEEIVQLTNQVKTLEQAIEREREDRDILKTLMWHAIGFSAQVVENALHEVRDGESVEMVVPEMWHQRKLKSLQSEHFDFGHVSQQTRLD
jgi:hypothetical protein